ncbi:MAG TPA: enoyl-CoA hydratase [Acetobacteraceae bacterium]|nr:enoyl-CoA hydratase [Acetobacteraceae bacterium]
MNFADGKILLDVDSGVALVTFNNPEKRNAMSLDMWDGLVAALDALEADPSVRVLVLTGAGSKAFVSGADISQFGAARADAEAQREYDRRTSGGRARLAAFPRPVIARIRGFCLGGGRGIALQADLRVAAEDSEFGIPAARLGLAYSAQMVKQLVSVVGPAHARMLLYTGSRIPAREAERIGLVNRVVADGELSDVVLDLARSIADNAPLSVRAAKLAVAGEDEAVVAAAIDACFDSEDYREGRAAFAGKRAPRFRGR